MEPRIGVLTPEEVEILVAGLQAIEDGNMPDEYLHLDPGWDQIDSLRQRLEALLPQRAHA